MEGPTFGRACAQREICVIKSAGLACSGNEIYHFCFVLLCTRGNSTYKPPGGLYSEGQFNGGFFALRFWRAYKVFFFFFFKSSSFVYLINNSNNNNNIHIYSAFLSVIQSTFQSVNT